MRSGIGIGIPNRRAGLAFTPASLANLAAWYRASPSDVTIGVGVSSWLDRSGNGRDATQGTAAQQPTLTTAAGLGGQHVISFDGNDALLTTAFTLPRECSVFFVLGSITSLGIVAEHGLGTNWYVYAVGNNAFYCQSQTVAQNPRTTWALANQQGSVVYDRTVDAAIRGNRTVLTPTAVSGLHPGAANTSGILTLGNRENLTLPHNGQIAEIIVYSRALSAPEIASIEAYLLGRYGV